MNKSLLLAFIFSFLLILPSAHAQIIYLGRADYYIELFSQFTCYKNNTLTTDDTYVFTLKTDISNYKKAGYTVLNYPNYTIDEYMPVHSSCYYVTDNETPMIENKTPSGYQYILPYTVQFPVLTKQTFQYSIYCISQNTFGNISRSFSPVGPPFDKVHITIIFEKTNTFLFEKYYNLQWANNGNIELSLDSSNKDFYKLSGDVTNPMQIANLVILFNEYFDWGSCITDAIIPIIIGAILHMFYVKIKSKLSKPSSTPPSEPPKSSSNQQNNQKKK